MVNCLNHFLEVEADLLSEQVFKYLNHPKFKIYSTMFIKIVSLFKKSTKVFQKNVEIQKI
jgi:hypothetical protein